MNEAEAFVSDWADKLVRLFERDEEDPIGWDEYKDFIRRLIAAVTKEHCLEAAIQRTKEACKEIGSRFIEGAANDPDLDEGVKEDRKRRFRKAIDNAKIKE